MNIKPNILLISVDSLRADHLGCYGYGHPTSPNIDALAEAGELCERLICPGIPTMPSYATLYTGQHPITHGIVAHPCKNELDKNVPFLPKLFLQAGYTTCALDSLMRSRIWFGRGYEFYIDPSIKHTLLYLAVTCEDINARAIPWLRAHASEPFFLFIHYWDPHWPFNPPERYRELFYQGNPTDPNNHSLDAWWKHPLGAAARDTWLRTENGLITDADYIVALYDQEIRYLDNGIGELIAALDELGLAENTIVMLTADHGESMTEHGIFFEHHGLYDCTIHVPLIVRWPGRLRGGGRLPHLLQLTDIAPTILEAAGLAIPDEMEGGSFWKLLTGEEQEGGHKQVISLECTWQAKWSLLTDTYKFILAREPDLYGNPPCELYDLLRDPQEKHNIAEEQPGIAGAMEKELEGWINARMVELGRNDDPIREHSVSLKGTLPSS
ncbi:MAG: sulfatase [Deltaproteobacteria bacterium]|nr:sulfatase [Deltaproteobacteria bacterium]MBW2306509.1 sulfatase [Deltaproteobacteria bacterium]